MTGLAPVDGWEMSRPCPKCGHEVGNIRPTGMQACCYCAECETFVYNVPRAEQGIGRQTVTSERWPIRPSVRARVLDAARGRCELCGKNEATLHIAHLFPYDLGVKEGFTPTELNDEVNLVALCDECNLGFGEADMHPILYLQLCRRRLHRKFRR